MIKDARYPSGERRSFIVQSNYLPWRGYFDLIRRADELILLDSVQYTRRDWRNRNIIKTPAGPQWITVPVEAKGQYYAAIDEVRVDDPGFAAKHVRAIELNYRKAAAFKETAPWLFDLLLEAGRGAAPERAQRAPSDGDRPQARDRDPDPPLYRPARARSHGGDGSDGEAAGALQGGRRERLPFRAERTRISGRIALP